MNKPELLAPAGDLSKLKIAIKYGADAVFVGGKIFSLRARANNFTMDDIIEGVKFARKYGAKIYVTVNIFPRDKELLMLDDYLLNLDKAGINGIIVSSIFVLNKAKALNVKYEIHISTQHSLTNIKSVEMFDLLKADRVVLARELSLKQIKNIKINTKISIEVFIHGGMCSSFSGRCTLSNAMSNRDANSGGCAHSCRWFYKLYENESLVSENPLILSSKDLMSINAIPELIDIGVDSLKIEGRMKSAHYIATVVKSYRQAIDDYCAGKKYDAQKYILEIKKAENRETSSGFLFETIQNEGLLQNSGGETPTQEFVAFTLEKSNQENMVKVEQRNYFKIGDKLEVFSSDSINQYFVVNKMYDEQNNLVEVARHPKQILYIYAPFKISKDSFIRKNDLSEREEKNESNFK